MSCQAAELSKWKSRAIKLKAKTKPELDKPGSPCTPTKRGPCSATESSHLLNSPKRFLLASREVLDSPSNVPVSSRKVLDSPKSSALDSPKSRFFDVGGTSELLSRTFPKQFFDNSNLGLPQGKFLALMSPHFSLLSGQQFSALFRFCCANVLKLNYVLQRFLRFLVQTLMVTDQLVCLGHRTPACGVLMCCGFAHLVVLFN